MKMQRNNDDLVILLSRDRDRCRSLSLIAIIWAYIASLLAIAGWLR